MTRGAARGAAPRDIRVSRDEAERLRFWAGRKAAFPAVGRISPDYYCMDGTIPRKRLARGADAASPRMEKKYGLRCAERVPRRRRQPASADPVRRQRCRASCERTEAFGAEILELCVEVGGTITGEHGVGVEKIDQMCVQFSADGARRCSTRVKRAFDPHGLLNPGKAVPTLHRCAEFGRMHVHGGELPHPGTAALLMLAAVPVQRIRDAAARERRCASAAAAARISTAGAARASPRHARLRRHRRLRADRAGDHRALRHAARRDRGGAGGAAADAGLRAAALRRRRDPRRLRRRRPLRAAPRQRPARCATSCSACAARRPRRGCSRSAAR